MKLYECDACGKMMPCVNLKPIKAAGGIDTHACHHCKGHVDCDDCDDCTQPIVAECCGRCGQHWEASDFETVMTCAQTWDSPAEYEDMCPECIGEDDPEDDGDRRYDEIKNGDVQPPVWWSRWR